MIAPEDRWEPWSADVVFLNGPDRVIDEHDPNVKPRPAGFLADLTTEPLTWEGDNA